jgi:hypothetical protein
MQLKRTHILFAILGLSLCAIPFRGIVRRVTIGIVQRAKGRKTISDRVAQYGDDVKERLSQDFNRVGIEYPPASLTLLALKQENQLEVWVGDGSAHRKHLKTYTILAASGTSGPKLKEGDRQVPEGLYRIESLNPNSLYHLALRINYPNAFDVSNGKRDGRDNLGGDIMIHGNSCSIGCLAMGDEAAEELFILAAETGLENIAVILSPIDFRQRQLPKDMTQPEWVPELYISIQEAMKPLNIQEIQ